MDGNDFEVLFPDGEVAIQGEKITVKEYSFIQGLQVDRFAKHLMSGLLALFSGETEDDAFEYSALAAVFAADPEAMLRLLALATGKKAKWIATLPDEEGQRLLMTWWAVNKDFFVRRLITAALIRQKAKAEQAEQDRLKQVALSGAPSSPG